VPAFLDEVIKPFYSTRAPTSLESYAFRTNILGSGLLSSPAAPQFFSESRSLRIAILMIWVILA
jgi:hypothetical protein